MKRLYFIVRLIHLFGLSLWFQTSFMALFFFFPVTVKAQCFTNIMAVYNFCDPTTITLVAVPNGVPPYSYLWSTGETTQSIVVPLLPITDYFVTVTDDTGCASSTSAHVKPGSVGGPPVIGPSSNPVCEGNVVILNIYWYFNNPPPGITYLWSNGDTGPSTQTTDPGVITVTITDPATGCTLVLSETIIVSPAANPIIVGPSSLCSGQTATLSVDGGPFDYYNWPPSGSGDPTFVATGPGIYWVYVQTIDGCVGIDTLEILPGSLPPTLNNPSPICPGQSVDLEVLNATSYTSFNWSTGGTGPITTVNGPGTYTVTVSASGGCTATGSVTVASVSSNMNLSGTITAVSSCSSPNGAINITISPTGTYSYIWSNNATTEDLMNIAVGSYSVTVTDSGGCTSSDTYSVTSNTISPNLTTVTVAATCGQNNGAVDLSISPPGSFTFLWSNSATTEDLTNIAAGSYSVTVTATGSGCTATAMATIPNTNPPINVPDNTTPVTSCTSNNGSIDISPIPSGTYTFIWSNGSTTEDLTNLSVGNYTVTVSSSAGCTGMATFNVVNNTTSPVPIATPTAAICGQSNGAIDLNVTPSGIYSFLWSNGSNSEDLLSIPGGNYSVTVTSSNGCTNNTSITVPDNTIPIIITGTSTPNTSCTNQNGTIDITINATGSFTYVWSNGANTEDLQNLSGGTYSLTVTGSNGCTGTEIFSIINANTNFSFNSSVIPNTSCISPNGHIDLTPTPAGTYTYNWSTGATTEDLQNLSSGNYSVTVADINNCSVIESFFITDNPSFPQITSQITPSACGNNNGAIDISLIPMNGNNFLWSNGSVSEDLSNLAAGNYMITVTSALGCMIIDTLTVDNIISNFTVQGLSVPNSSCSNPNGSIDLSITPTGSYSFLWTDGEITEDLQNIVSGSYGVTITDISNCTSVDTFLVSNNTTFPTVSGNLTSANCGANNGAINLLVSPATTSFLWSTSDITEDLQNLFPGNYSVLVTDTTNGCQTLDSFSIPNINNNFFISASILPNTSCINQNGSIDLSIAPSGSYTFLWSNGITTEDISNLSTGIYSVTVTDNVSCSSSAIFTVDNNVSAITFSESVIPSTCGNNNGAIDLTINPSVGNSFLWSNGATTEDIQNILSGNYNLTITGSNGCTISDTIIVPDVGTAISLSAIPTPNTNCILPNGSIDLNIFPVGAYTYLWSNGTSTEDLINLTPGFYSVTVSDSNGCSSAGSYIIDDQTIALVINENISPSTCGQNNGQIDISISPAGNYQFIWSTGDTNQDLQNISSGTYFVTVTSINGCSANMMFIVPNSNSNFSISALTSDNTTCTTSNGTLNLTLVPGGTYTFAWSTGATSEDIQNLPAGIYTVTVSDNFNCSTVSSFTLAQNVVDLIVEETITPPICGEANGRIDLTVAPSSGNSFIWSDGSTTQNLQNILPGLYSVTITGQNGCTWTSEINLPGNEKIELTLKADAIQSGDQFVTIRSQINLPLSALDTLVWLPENLFSCTQKFCLEQTIARPSQKTEIIVMAVDTNGCAVEARLLLDDDTKPQVYIPNVFTPNGDGVNDLFTVYGNDDVEQILELRIFDRWGNFVFFKTDFPPNEEHYGWDGKFRNSDMNPAVYAYWARVRFVDGTEGLHKGDITLVR